MTDSTSILPDSATATRSDESAVFSAIARILIVQTWVSGTLALVIVLCAVVIPLVSLFRNDPSITTPEVIQNWGGVVIGFYFGSSLTQMGSLLASLKGKGSA